ncbi:MAG: hypothetical protein ACUVTD_08000 [Nitrososphaerales archaeon]
MRSLPKDSRQTYSGFTFNGKYVAVFQGIVVGCDEEKARLARSIYEKYGYVPIYIDKVAPSERFVEIPSPELKTS